MENIKKIYINNIQNDKIKLISEEEHSTIYLDKAKKEVVKYIDKNNCFPILYQLRRGIEIQESLDYPGIVKIKDKKEESDSIFIYYEYCENNSLQHLINERKKLTEKEVQNYMIQLIISLNYLHTNNIIHRNLINSKLLLDGKMKLKISGFGLSIKLDKKFDKLSDEYEANYKAPEAYNSEEKGYSSEVDIWSLGIIMFQLLTGKYPQIEDYKYEKNNKDLVLESISSSKMSNAAKDLIKQILVIDPLQRPTLNQIIYHDFFNREGIPKYFPTFSLKQFNEEFPEEILNQEGNFPDLKSLIKPAIGPISYDSFKNLKEIKKNPVKDIDIYIKRYYDYYSKYGVGYLLNNGYVGVFFRDKTKMILNPKNDKFLYIDKNDKFLYIDKNENNDNIRDVQDVHETLTNKKNILERFKNFLLDEEKKEKNKISNEMSFSKQEDNGENFLIYVNNLVFDKKFIFFKLSNQTQHIFFYDGVEIIISDEVLTYIGKNKNKSNLSLESIRDNPIRELIKRYNYIKIKYKRTIENRLHKKLEKMKEK